MTLSDEMKLWQEQMQALLEQGEKLIARMDELEQQNKLLQEQVSREGLHSRSMQELSAIYDDGYHICHAGFGRPREGEDCIFCLTFLHTGGR
ncbi:MAG: DUF972 family protein [Firmicutes bacterium]|nr:DUF972 family protein [Bacillota bacterium]